MKKHFLLLVMLLPVVASADIVKYQDLYYNLVLETKQAEVISTVEAMENKHLEGIPNIPKTIEYKEEEYSVTSIGDHAFANCNGITSITIPSSVTTIADYAFYNCNGLTSIKIGNGVTSIGAHAFDGCSKLTSVTIPNSVTTIGEWAFFRGFRLSSVTIGNGVIVIGDYAFCTCSALTTVTIPNNVTIIGKEAFRDCSGLTSVTIGNGVTRMGNRVFNRCSGLTAITVDGGNSSYASEDGVLFNKDKTTLIQYPQAKSETSYVIPTNVTSIEKNAFEGCHNLTSVTMPNGLSRLDHNVFFDCSSLTSVTIGESISWIGTSFVNCPQLTDVFCLAENVPSAATNAFEGSNIEHATLHVPAASVDAYKAVAPWSNFKEVVAIDGSLNGVASVSARSVMIQNNGSTLNIQGTDDGSTINVYSVNGTQINSVVSSKGQAVVNTTLQKGSMAIVKIGRKSVKVVMK